MTDLRIPKPVAQGRGSSSFPNIREADRTRVLSHADQLDTDTKGMVYILFKQLRHAMNLLGDIDDAMLLPQDLQSRVTEMRDSWRSSDA